MNQSMQNSLIVLILFQIVSSNEISVQQPILEPQTISSSSLQNQNQIEYQTKYHLNTRNLQYNSGCPNHCNNHGTCNYSNKVCICDANWIGADCLSSPLTGILNSPDCVTCKTRKQDCPEECQKDQQDDQGQKTMGMIGLILGLVLLCCCMMYCCRVCSIWQKRILAKCGYGNLRENIVVPEQSIIDRSQSIFHLQNEIQSHIIQIQNSIDDSRQEQKQNFKKYQLPPIEDKLRKQIEVKDCSICLDNINSLELYKINCPSRHGFHKKCIDQWFQMHSTCPQCRAYIISK